MRIEDAFFFDIETVGTNNVDIIDIMLPKERKTASDAPKNYKKEEAIEKWIESEWQKTMQEREDFLSTGALDIDTAVIVSVAWAVGDGDINCIYSTNEKELLRSFIIAWNEFVRGGRDRKSVGYNSINYDWAVIKRRMSFLGVNTWDFVQPNMNRYYGEIDLMNVAYNFGYSAGKVKGLKTLSKLFGIEPLVEDTTGANVIDMTPEEIIEYNKSDVYLTREVFKKFNGIYL